MNEYVYLSLLDLLGHVIADELVHTEDVVTLLELDWLRTTFRFILGFLDALVQAHIRSILEQWFIEGIVLLIVMETLMHSSSLVEEPLIVHQLGIRRLSLPESNLLTDISLLIPNGLSLLMASCF